ncbi:MAG: gliding motility-associated C-terminal domain-containing protein [Crocinitomicaceae bacterium]|nr:gliding motility-associated C-terminal domain-containing protein [Crocinitomicaceae bacterium]
MTTALTAPAMGASTVNCPADAIDPGAPLDITDGCGNTVSAVLVGSSPAPACEGDVVWTYSYTDCALNTINWTHTYTVDMPTFAIATAAGTSTVNCPTDANVQPAGPGVITDLCGNVLVAAIANDGPQACEGDVVWTFTYTDCASNVVAWTHTYTIDIPAFTIPYLDDASIVNCVADAQVDPGDPGVVVDECGNVLIPVITPPSPTGCTGVGAVWTYTYTDCALNTADWIYTYTVNLAPFAIATLPGASTVDCPADAMVQPGDAGVVNDACGNAIIPTVATPVAVGCEGDMVWIFTYTDCAGNTLDWLYTYTVDMTTALVAPAFGTSTVNCPANASDPGAPADILDGCGNTVSAVLVGSDPLPACEGAVVWTYSYTDCALNTINWTHTYTIDMTTALSAPAAGVSTVNCPADAIDPGAPLDITDGCGNTVSAVLVGSDPLPACEGDVVWTYSYTDCALNTVNWTHTYTIDMPTFAIATAAGTSTVNCPTDANAQPAGPGVITDLCGNVLAPVVANDGPLTCEGDVIWTFTYTDCALNVVAWTHTYTIDIPAFAIATAPGVSIVNCPADGMVQPADAGVVTDMCGNVLVPAVTAPSAVGCTGGMIWTFTYTDCAGNTLDWLYTYTVNMSPFAIATAPGASIVNCPADGLVQPADAGVVTDLCGNVLIPTVTPPLAVACEGDMVWTFTYTDCAGNTLDWLYTYTVDMPTFAIATAPGVSTVNCPADAMVQPADAGAIIDLCGNPIIPAVVAPIAVGCEGDMVWTFTYTDCASNVVVWTHTYTVDMTTALVAPAMGTSTVNCPADATDPGAPLDITDGCGNTVSAVLVGSDPLPACEGTVVWTYSYTDCALNTVNWTHTYTVDMPTFAIAIAAGTSTVNCPADANAQPAGPGVVTDLCGNVLAPAVVNDGPLACEGDVVWTFTYTDCASNVVAWTHTYTIDIPAFAIATASGASIVNCPADGMVQPADAGVITDLCGNILVPVIAPPSAVGCTGGMIWTFTYTDCALNTLDWTYTYTVDLPAFAIATPAGASTVDCPADAMVQPADAGVVTDMCGNVLIPTVTAPVAVGCEGDMVWTFTYTDCASNTLDWIYTYTVDMPTFILPVDGTTTVECLAQATAPVPPVMDDVCGNAVIPVMTENADPICEGDKIYTFTYTDCASNVEVWTYTYTIDVITAPVVPANEAEAVICFTDIYMPTPPVVTDVCGNNIVPVMTENADPVCTGDKIYTFTYTDCAGNASVWTYTFSINDNIAPTASNPTSISVAGSMNVPPFDVTVVTDEADNCDPNPTVTWISDVSTGTVCVDEVIIRTYEIEDACGNTTTVTQEIAIEAIYPPLDAGPNQTICQGESATLTADNPMGIIPIVWTNPVVDNQSFFPTQTGVYTVTLDNLGCISTDDVTVTVEDPPVVSFMGDILSGCEPLTVTFTNTSVSVSPLVDCIWNIEGAPLPIEGCTDITYTFPVGGTYDVTLTTTSAIGCTASVTYTDYIYVESAPLASFTTSGTDLTTIMTDVNFTNTSIGATDYMWTFGDGSGSTTEEHPSHTYPYENGGSYIVWLYAYSPLGCVDSVSTVITVEEETIFWVPNTFTPDGDMYNEYFKAVFTSGYDPYDFHLLIFNRWGEIIWESFDASIGWDGTYNGELVEDGTYTWKIDFKTTQNDERKLVTGHVNVIK